MHPASLPSPPSRPLESRKSHINFGGLVNSYTAATGALRANGQGTAPLSQRQRFDSRPLDFGATQAYTIKADSTGQLAAFLDPAVTNMAIGATAEGTPHAFVGAQVLARSNVSIEHGVFFGVRLPNVTGEGVFVSPLGVLNAASFAPPTYPISGGTLISLFGSSLAPSTEVAQAIPLPTSLGGVTVTIDGVPSPLLFVSTGQINLQVPFATSGNSGIIVANNNGSLSDEVEVPVAESSPGIFSAGSTGVGPGTVVQSDFQLVSESNPATPGETIIVFLTGLGATHWSVTSLPLGFSFRKRFLLSFNL